MKTNATVFAALAAMIWMNGCGGQDPVSSQNEGSDSPAAKLVVTSTKAGRGLGAKTATAFSAQITGDQAVPAVTTNASGTGSFTLNEAKTELRFKITVNGQGLRSNTAYFQNGTAGVVRGFSASETTRTGKYAWSITGIWSSTDGTPLTPALVKELEAGNIYVNFPTPAHKSGEICGRLIPQGRTR